MSHTHKHQRQQIKIQTTLVTDLEDSISEQKIGGAVVPNDGTTNYVNYVNYVNYLGGIINWIWGGYR